MAKTKRRKRKNKSKSFEINIDDGFGGTCSFNKKLKRRQEND